MKYAGQQIAVIGAGSSGKAAARLACAHGGSVTLADSGTGDALGGLAAEMAEDGIMVKIAGDAFVEDPTSFAFCVVSPGIDPESKLAQHFSTAGVSLISEIEFGFQNSKVPVVAITGTNGKTTTTELISVIFNAVGLKSVPCGNYGLAYCDVVRGSEVFDVHTVEVSSFQLELIDSFRPVTSVWMNFAPDHLDRHPNVAAYRDAKLRIFENQTAGDCTVINAADVPSGIAAEKVTFSAFGLDADFTLADNKISCKGDELIDFSKTRLRGKHNAENVMAAMAAVHSRGVEFSAMTEAVYSYQPPRHRCELVAVIDDIEFINDSKSTNLHSLESSLRSLRPPLVLIAGGKNKGLDYSGVRKTVHETCSHVVAIGEIAQSLVDCWGSTVSCEIASDMADAVRRAKARASRGQVVLLSPGTSSFDMFGGYQERGDAFCQNVNRLL
ncbi:MAG: UDP-N-acetylmuramoyl-L-alanine--D-glutamate ligase [Verrucomicrobiae bacterium]|nr:UDP-N-acetylmuramoyl-L-alanine--D-glutamate ligase [Verrucomicrobiae bacterium]